MRSGISFSLSASDRLRLDALVADRNTPQKHVWRARIVLLSADGLGTHAIMREGGVSKTAVWRWQERFAREGLAGLLREKTRPARIPPLGPEVAARVVALTQADPPGEIELMRWMPPTNRHFVCLTVESEPIIGVIDDDDQHVDSRSVEGQLSGLRRRSGRDRSLQPRAVALTICRTACRSTGLHRGNGGLCDVASLGRVAQASGHEVRLVPAVYVKPFVKRQKNDRADVEAIAEAAARPRMRFVAVKSAETQGRAVAFRTHQCLVRQRTQLINALRGHLAEFGVVAPKGPANLKVLEEALADEVAGLPGAVRAMEIIYLDQIAGLTQVIERLADELETASRMDADLRRLCTIPGIGLVTAGAVAAFAPDLDTFDSGRNFAAWLGLVPRQRSTGGKAKLGSVSKMGQTDIRRLLIVGAMSVIRWVVRKGGSANRWLATLVTRRLKMVAAVALANKMARMIWAVTTKQEDYRMA
ncbi:Transposase [Methylobacterium sp. 190mf]|nr:Transposase [Methylobacterium sp. 190mf]